MTLEPGQTIGGYRIVGVLGRGGLGAVYRCQHLISQREEALKVMLPEQTSTPGMTERFLREIQLLATLNHPNIAKLNHAFYWETQLVMAMELVEGEDLRSRTRRGALPIPTLIGYTSEVLLGLEYAHGRGVVHRDLKPANIMISAGAGTVKLLDFGIALAGKATDLTAAGSLIGSPTYMSPEQARGEKATPQSDIYSLGITLYELLTGQPPFVGDSPYELVLAHVQRVPRPLHELRPDIPPALSDVIARALEKDPAHRYSSAWEFRNALLTLDSSATRSATPIPGSTWPQPNMSPPTPQPSFYHPGQTPAPQPTAAFAPGVTPPPNAGPGSHPQALSPQAQEALTRHLATFIGPIAKVVVSRLTRQITDLDQLYTHAAAEIDTEADRARFLKTRPR